MKLYTEEQVRRAMQIASKHKEYEIAYMYALDSLTPIELPSDEEIFSESIKIMEEWYGSGCTEEIDAHFRGAKWMKEQITKQL